MIITCLIIVFGIFFFMHTFASKKTKDAINEDHRRGYGYSFDEGVSFMLICFAVTAVVVIGGIIIGIAIGA